MRSLLRVFNSPFLFIFVFSSILFSIKGFAQAGNMMMSPGEMHPMCGMMGWGGMILGSLLIISAICALVALTVFLVRRSRTHS